MALVALAGAVPAQDEAAANAAFDEQFAAGLEALRSGETSKAWRAFTRCRDRIAAMSPERQAVATFVTELFLVETRLRVGRAEDSALFRDLEALADAARASGAWAAERMEYYRLRAMLLLEKTAPPGAAGASLNAEDRRWLLGEEFFASTPTARSLHDDARVLRLRLAQGTDRELPMLQELVAAERAHSERRARGGELPADERERWTKILETLATYHAQRRNFDRAQIYAHRMPVRESVALRGWLALQREDHAVAIGLAEELRALSSASTHQRLAADQMLAEALEASGEPDRALRHYEAVLRVAKDDATSSAAQNGLGDCLLALGRTEEARAAYDTALALCHGPTIGSMAERAETRKDLGRLCEREGDPVGALSHYLAALAIGEDVRARLLADPFGGSWLRVHADQTTALDGVLRTWQAADGDPWSVMHALELGRARGALDLVAGRGGAVDAGQLRALVTRHLLAESRAEVEEVAADLDALRAHATRAAEPVAVPGPHELREFVNRHPTFTVLSWWFGREQAWLLVVRGGEVQAIDLPSPDDCGRHVVAAWRAVRSADGDRAALRAAADCLLPVEVRALLGRDVLAVLDPTMVRLPLAALEIEGTAFGVLHRLVQAPSLAVACLLEGRRKSDARPLVVEAPERTELADRLGLDPLRFAADECAAVLAAHGDSLHLEGAGEATLHRLEQELPRAPGTGAVPGEGPSLLHVAAHAVDCAGFPTQSLLLLADGPLAMAGLRGLRLDGTLVVFSACAAATGEQRGHEGVIGLVEGALATGARSVVAPVAPVNQQATADFMKLVHGAIARGADAATALQHARRKMAASDNYAHPHYWGSFTSFGAPTVATSAAPASGQPFGVGWPVLLGALVLAAAGLWLLRGGPRHPGG